MVVFKDHLLETQKKYIRRKRKAGKNAKRPLSINKVLLDLYKHRKKVYRERKQEWVTFKEYEEV